ncbi:XrtA-associated tyrosine autokinase [Thauera sinica]|uniref:non-specific protein-tyrosine kinase n=1 Tax=Thauera sinica TaxID=2665146 RepID=A0ABW1AY15_9RHOO|nr:XrtA-associated tyrosine autokinase [Thauera sp. K11]ATE60945.1 chromosome partitioning ATPase [Thauera sp. K11]
MSLIEKAAQRLEKLKQAAGDEIDVVEPVAAVRPEPPAPAAEPAPAVQSSAVPRQTPLPANPVVSRSVDIDLERLRHVGMVTPEQSRGALADEFRVIKRPLLQNATAAGPTAIDNGNLIMVTSALPGEGKSFTAINLAISMAMELDHTVLLVDADVSRPSVLRHLGLPPERGLMDVLSGEVDDLGEVLLRTNIEKLSILPAGMPHPRATELLASDNMNQLLEQIAKRYADRIVVFDSPPLLVTTEARVLATHMGQVVMVVEAERTTQGSVKQALATIEACPIKLMVLNKSRRSGPGSYYGYGYGYGYGAEGGQQAA